MIAIGIEVDLEVARAGDGVESFNLLYTIFRFPLYWVAGILWSACVAWQIRRYAGEAAPR